MVTSLGHGPNEAIAAAAEQADAGLLHLQPAVHEPGAGGAGRGADRARARGLRPRALRHRRRGGERDGAAAGARLPRRARRAGAHADRLARPGLPRPDDGHARPDRPPGPARALRRRSSRRSCTSRPRAGASTRPARPPWTPSTACSPRRGPVPSRPSSASRSAPRRSPRYSPPDAFWRGLDERRAEHGFLICLDEVVTGIGRTGHLVRRRAAADRGRHHHDRQGPRARATPRSGRCCAATTSTPPSSRARARSSTATPGTGRRCRAPSGARCSPSSRAAAWWSACASAARRCATSSPPRSQGCELVREVRGRGFLLGVDYVDPRDGESPAAAGARRGAPDRHDGARARADRLLDAADRRRLRRRPDAARPRLRRERRRAARDLRAARRHRARRSRRWVKQRLGAPAAAPA